VAEDRSIRLWDVAQVKDWMTPEAFNFMVCMSAAKAANTELTDPPPANGAPSSYMLRCSSGTFNVFDARVSTLVYASPLVRRAPALLSIAHDPSSHLVATGNTTGVVEIYDTCQLPSPSSSSSGLIM